MIVFMVDLTERYVFVLMIFILSIYQYVQSELKEKHRNKPSLEKHDEKEISNLYSSLRANEFLTYDKCMQRMKCPDNRKEECSEECQAGNTEEEIEEHKELTISEHRNSINKKPKPKYDKNKQSDKNKQQQQQQPSNQSNQSTIKTDL